MALHRRFGHSKGISADEAVCAWLIDLARLHDPQPDRPYTILAFKRKHQVYAEYCEGVKKGAIAIVMFLVLTIIYRRGSQGVAFIFSSNLELAIGIANRCSEVHAFCAVRHLQSCTTKARDDIRSGVAAANRQDGKRSFKGCER